MRCGVARVNGCLVFAAVWSAALYGTAQTTTELRIEATDCADADRQRFAELLILDLRDEGEVIDRALTISLSCKADSAVIRATDRRGGVTVERTIPPLRSKVGQERVLALTTSQLLRVAQWTEPQAEVQDKPPQTEIVLEEGPPPEPEPPALQAVQPTTPTARGTIGIGGLVRSHFPGDRLTTFGAELRGAIRIHGPWWAITKASFDMRTTASTFGDVQLLDLSLSAGVAWRKWWTARIGWEAALWLGGGYSRLKGSSELPSVSTRTNGSAIFVAEAGAGPRWRVGRVLIGADLRLGVTVPRLGEAQPLGTTTPTERFSPGVAFVGGALTLDVEL